MSLTQMDTAIGIRVEGKGFTVKRDFDLATKQGTPRDLGQKPRIANQRFREVLVD